jgi:hypothetical protein
MRHTPPLMGAEDFSFMLETRPGAYIFLGNGDTAMVHHPAYNFDDMPFPSGRAGMPAWPRRGCRLREGGIDKPARNAHFLTVRRRDLHDQDLCQDRGRAGRA